MAEYPTALRACDITKSYFEKGKIVIRKFTLKGIAHRITQDVLILGAREDHFIMPKLFHEEYDLLKNVRSLTLSLMTDRQDAGAHCNVGNTKLALDTMADWIIQRKREE